MNVIREIKEVRDGTVSIDVPSTLLHRKVEIIVIPLDEVSSGSERGTQKGWLPGFFEKTAGCFADDPIQRPPRGTMNRGEILHELPS
jgi:hypothetical protein